MDLVFVLKWVKSVIGCALYIFHPSDPNPYLWTKQGLISFTWVRERRHWRSLTGNSPSCHSPSPPTSSRQSGSSARSCHPLWTTVQPDFRRQNRTRQRQTAGSPSSELRPVRAVVRVHRAPAKVTRRRPGWCAGCCRRRCSGGSEFRMGRSLKRLKMNLWTPM